MRFRLDAQHYINDRLLEPGHIIGDGTDVPFVDAKGRQMQPSVSMTPLDDEAWDVFKQRFPGTQMPERDPTKAIPLQGTGDKVKAPPLFQEEDGRVIQPTGAGPVKTVDDIPGGYVEGKDRELKKGLPDSGSPNHPVGQPVIGIPSAPGTTPVVPPKPEDPNLRVNAPAAEQKAVADAQKKAQDDAAKAAAAKANEQKK